MPKKHLSEYIIEDIKTMLRTGQFREGEKLPNQNEFARMLGVSRVSLREALHKLEMMDVIVQRPKTGTVIINGDPNTWDKPSENIELANADDTIQMLTARKCVETVIALEAAKRMTEQQEKSLMNIYEEMYATIEAGDAARFLVIDKEFHLLIAEISGNQYLQKMYEITLRHEDEYMKNIFMKHTRHLKKLVLAHKLLCEALAEADDEKIKRATRKHSVILDDIVTEFYTKITPQVGALYYP